MSSELQYGCIFCRTGRESEVASFMEHEFSGIKAVVPKKIRYRRSHGIATEEEVILFPGYVFFESQPELYIPNIVHHKDVYRLLTDPEGNWALHNSDEAIVRQFVSIGGKVGFSKAFYEGDRIRIADGFLKQYEGEIVRVNRRAKTAQIRIHLDGKLFSLWAGFEIVSKCDGNDVSDMRREKAMITQKDSS